MSPWLPLSFFAKPVFPSSKTSPPRIPSASTTHSHSPPPPAALMPRLTIPHCSAIPTSHIKSFVILSCSACSYQSTIRTTSRQFLLLKPKCSFCGKPSRFEDILMGFRPQWRCWSCDFVNFTESGDGWRFSCLLCRFNRKSIPRDILWFCWEREEREEKARFKYSLAMRSDEVEMLEEASRRHNRKIQEKKTGFKAFVEIGTDRRTDEMEVCEDAGILSCLEE